MKKRIAIIFFSDHGFALAGKIRDIFENDVRPADGIPGKIDGEEWAEVSKVVLYRKTNLEKSAD